MEIDILSLGERNSVTGELNALKNDRKMIELAVTSQQNRWRDNLCGSMGKDIEDVLSGKVKIKVPLKLKIKYYFNRFIDTLIKIL